MWEKKKLLGKKESQEQKKRMILTNYLTISIKKYIVIEDLELILIEYFHSRCSKFNQTKRIRFER